MAGSASSNHIRHMCDRRAMLLVALAAIAIASLGLLTAAPALAGQAASGELFFYPCTDCHPVQPDGSAAQPIPGDFEGHEIALEGHDILGADSAACAACHDDPAKDPGKMKVVGGGFVDIDGDVAKVCHKCHQEKYNSWLAGTHGRHEPTCSAAGCHDPHTPGYMYFQPLMPFVGSGFQFRVLPETEAFQPLMPPAPQAPTTTPAWFALAAALGVVVAGGQAFRLVRGRQKR